ncbi:hypothetical protein MettiDRAFT_1240 [Methanolobus tindarius DSM 2278]|uniref:Uncharacterized protein n=1 Tax=Methanolobus tindarius DSM 2278 TaxID=1090322 RepID=W9DQV6_METTI|nr:hypothetical protein [Methanolobus tindarius]ETA67805.1 hypothetical protein MettiDRAFT_1240 [Methanolobus tindarius DSM 2278]
MAEAMTVETVIQAYWDLKGYWTKLRVPLKLGGWTDIDVVAYNPLKKELVLAESKVRSTKHTVRAYTEDLKDSGVSFLDFDKKYGNSHGTSGKLYYLSFIDNINNEFLDLLFETLNLPKDDVKIIVHFVSNYHVDEGLLESAQNEVKKRIEKQISSPYSVDNVIIQTTFDVLCDVIAEEEMSEQGRRYGHPVLDIAREFNRYMHPDIHLIGSREVAYKKGCKEEIKQKLRDKISKSFGIL